MAHGLVVCRGDDLLGRVEGNSGEILKEASMKATRIDKLLPASAMFLIRL